MSRYADKTLPPLFSRRQDIAATVLVVLGCIVAIIFGPRTTQRPNITARDLLRGFLRLHFITFFVAFTTLILVDYIAVKIVERRNYKFNKMAQRLLQKTCPAEHRLPMRIYFGQTFLMLSYTTIAAYWGSLSLLATKSFAELFVSLFVSWQQTGEILRSAGTWLILVGFVVTNVCLEHFKQKALSFFGALLVVPIYQVQVIVFGILCGAIFFNELHALSTAHLCLFFVAIAITICGVAVLSSSMGMKHCLKMHMIVRRQLLVMKAINALLSHAAAAENVTTTTTSPPSQSMMLISDADTPKRAMIRLLSKEAQKLRIDTAAVYVAPVLSEVESVYQTPINGVLAPMFNGATHTQTHDGGDGVVDIRRHNKRVYHSTGNASPSPSNSSPLLLDANWNDNECKEAKKS